MVNAKYLHSSAGGSYNIECEIIEKRKYDIEKDGLIVDKVMMREFKMLPHNFEKTGYVIRYFDSYIDEEVMKWVEEDLVEIKDEKRK